MNDEFKAGDVVIEIRENTKWVVKWEFGRTYALQYFGEVEPSTDGSDEPEQYLCPKDYVERNFVKIGSNWWEDKDET